MQSVGGEGVSGGSSAGCSRHSSDASSRESVTTHSARVPISRAFSGLQSTAKKGGRKILFDLSK